MKIKIPKILTACVLVAANLLPLTIRRDVSASDSRVIGYELPHWHETVTYNGGWEHHEGDMMYFFDIDGEDNIGYCLEPGRHRSDNDTLDLKDADALLSGTGQMTAEEEKETLQRILFYGYGGGYYCDGEGSARELGTGDPEDPEDNLYYAVATQILIWEVIVGERDYYGGTHGTGAANVALTIFGDPDYQDEEEHEFHLRCDYWYHKIENRVFSDNTYDPATGRGSSYGRPRPSFSSMYRSSAPVWEVGSNGYVKLEDLNEDISDYDFTDIDFFVGAGTDQELDPGLVSYSISGDTIEIWFDPSADPDNITMRLRSNLRGRGDIRIYDDGIYGDGDDEDNLQAVAVSGGGFYGITSWVAFEKSMGTFSLQKTASSDGDVVSGISFTVESLDGNGSFEGTTDGNGDLVFEDGDRVLELVPGNYRVTEQVPETYLTLRDGYKIPYTYDTPEGWTKTEGGFYTDILIDGGQDITLRAENIRQQGGVEVSKDIPEGDTFDPGTVTFKLYLDSDSDGKISSPDRLVATGDTSSDGSVSWDFDVTGLPFGQYVLTETWEEESMDLEDGSSITYVSLNLSGWTRIGDNSYETSFVIDGDRDLQVVNEELTNSLRVLKVTGTDGDSADISFELRTSGGSLVARGETSTTGERGEGCPVLWDLGENEVETIERLPAGDYRIVEYIPDSVYIDPVTGETGDASYTYDVPEGFTLSSDGTYFYRDISVEDAEDQVVTISCENIRKQADLKIRKVSEEGVVSGIAFDLYYRGNEVRFDSASAVRVFMGTYVTGEDGTVDITGLPYGWYDIEEQYPEYNEVRFVGGTAGNGIKRVHLTSASPSYSTEITAINIIKASVSVSKVDGENGELVPGAVFDIYADINGNGIVDGEERSEFTRISDDDNDGVVVFEGLGAGSYLIAEAEAPENYLLSEECISVDVEKGMLYEVSFADQPYKALIRIRKCDGDDPDHLLSGAVFELYEDVDSDGVLDPDIDVRSSVSFVETTDDNGDPVYVTDGGLRAGDYLILETVSPEGFSAAEGGNVTPVTITPDVDTLNMEYLNVTIGNYCRGTVHITKIDELYPDNRLSGAVFTVFDLQGNVVGTMREENVGEYYLRDLPWGDYIVEETVAPPGFNRSNNTYPFSIRTDGETVDIEDPGFTGVANDATGALTIVKCDGKDTDILLPGAVFSVYIDVNADCTYSEGIDVFYGSVEDEDGDGCYRLEDIPRQNYIVREEIAPEGYETDPNWYAFSVTAELSEIIVGNDTYTQIDGVRGLFLNEGTVIGTTLGEKETGKTELLPEGIVTLEDVVSYKGLIVGMEYELQGELRDKETGEVLKDSEGNDIRTQVIFTAEDQSGQISVFFDVDVKDLRGKDIVCFEYMYRDGKQVGHHTDINDSDQTVTITRPEPVVSGVSKELPGTGESWGSGNLIAGILVSVSSVAVLICYMKQRRKDI
ncbi:MAG TPA: hypothetical protein DCW41_02900 [Clostridiales bacterium]|nr:hypothetical protein [Clostridiales bacterium]